MPKGIKFRYNFAKLWAKTKRAILDTHCMRHAAEFANFKCEVERSKMNKKLSYRRETARQLRIHAQLTRCFSAVAV